MNRLGALPTVLLGLLCASGAAMPAKTDVLPAAPAWAIDPAAPGENLPPTGRSLFDRVFAQSFTVSREGRTTVAPPYPFDRLLARLDAQLARDPASPLPPAKRVLIPLGRSLQRTAAAPDYFGFPRVVVAVDSPPASPSAPFLKDRLYIGYQEKSAVLEVISYNETAGRFEFQLVKDYRAGGKPQVVYANRMLCVACHQNGAPIFSRALWDETNANPQVAARLVASGKDFYGIPPERGVDVPYAIDIAVKRANGFALTQRAWQDACGGDDPIARRCRTGLFTAALRHALSDGRKWSGNADFNSRVATRIRAESGRRWPNGLAVPAADIPNRNPLQGVANSPDDTPRRAVYAHVPARFEPLSPRPPQSVWRVDAADAIDQIVGGLAEFVAATDRRRLEAALAKAPAQVIQHRAPCRFDQGASRWSVRCQPTSGESGPQLTVTLETARSKISGGRLERLVLPDTGALSGIALAAVAPGRGERFAFVPDRAPRGADGNPLARIAFRVPSNDPSDGSVTIEVRQEFSFVEQAVAILAESPDGPALFGSRPFPREQLFAALLARLAAPGVAACCQMAATLPPPRLEVPAAEPGSPATTPVAASVQGFYPYCAACHQSAEDFPPNFLQGNAEQVTAAMRQCAPRLYVRLAMADLAPDQRDKTPMPPESLLPAFATDVAGWRASPARAALLAQAAEWLRAESGQPPDLARLLAGGYEALRPCLTTP